MYLVGRIGERVVVGWVAWSQKQHWRKGSEGVGQRGIFGEYVTLL